jgi:glutathione synthase/RimK-type ligase-like ATP-grasp enzyme
MWLVKPTNLNQGRGIEIFSDLDKMLAFINNRSAGSLCVVQKYIERPLLYK